MGFTKYKQNLEANILLCEKKSFKLKEDGFYKRIMFWNILQNPPWTPQEIRTEGFWMPPPPDLVSTKGILVSTEYSRVLNFYFNFIFYIYYFLIQFMEIKSSYTLMFASLPFFPISYRDCVCNIAIQKSLESAFCYWVATCWHIYSYLIIGAGYLCVCVQCCFEVKIRAIFCCNS